MTKKFCKQCGNALKAGAKFCASCGATVDGADTDDVSNKETRALPGEKTDQIVPATEVIPAITPTSYETEEMPRPVTTGQVEERATEVIEAIAPTPATQALKNQTEPASAEERATEVIEAIAPTPVKQKPKKQAEPAQEKKPAVKSPKKQAEPAQEKKPAVQQSGGRKKLAVAAALSVIVLVTVVAASFIIINSRRASEAQAEIQPANNAEPSTPSQPVAQPPIQEPSQQANQQPGQPSVAAANNQAQSQTRPQTNPSGSDVKSPAVRNDESALKPQPQAAAKPTATVPQEKQIAGGNISVEQILGQGMTHLNARRYQEALQEFERVRKLDPGNKDIYYLIGSAYQGMNQLQQALESYRQCTSGTYVTVAQNAIKNVEKKVGKVSAK